MYRIIQEALQNVTRHADASSAHIFLEFEPTRVRVTVQDDGKGFDTEKVLASLGTNLGLIGIKEN